MRTVTKLALIAAGVVLVALIGGAVAAVMIGSDSDEGCAIPETERRVLKDGQTESLPPVGGDALREWASSVAGYEALIPCDLPAGMVFRGVTVNTNVPVVRLFGTRLEVTVIDQTDVETPEPTKPYLLVTQFPQQRTPSTAMARFDAGIGEKAAWKEETTLPRPDVIGGFQTFYLIHLGTGTVTVQLYGTPATHLDDSDVQRLLRSMTR